MSSSRYAEYKTSDIPWIATLPSHWLSVPLMGVASERNESNAGMVESNLLSLSYGRIVRKDICSNDGLLPESFETYQVVHPGDIVFRPTDLQNDWTSLRTAIVKEVGIITSAYIAVHPVGISPRYFNFLLRAYDLSKVFYSMGGGLRQSLKYSDIKRLQIVKPPLAEQTAIADFLDRETGKIDALVAEQQKLIALLKEKRQAVISHAVTKGLNPQAPMKSSGIEWLGDVPAHWEVKPLKFAAQVQTGIAKGKDTEGQSVVSVPYLRVANVQDGYLDLSEVAVIDIAVNALERYRLQPGDVLMNEGGDFDKLGRGHIWRGEIEVCIHQNHVFAVRPSAISPEWLNVITGSDYAQFYFMTRAKQSTNLASISSSNLMELPVVIPPPDERDAVVAFIAAAAREADVLNEQAKLAVTLLNERRSALISAAVTGQIDVRGLAVAVGDAALGVHG